MTTLPTWPYILFAVVEPLSLVAGFLGPVMDLEGFIIGQAPKAPVPTTLPPSTIALAYQLGNLYLLLMMLGVVVLYGTSNPTTHRNYLIALAIADVGHIYSTYTAIGWDSFVDLGSWNAVTWGNIGASAFLFVNRIAYLLGLFGSPKAPKRDAKMA